MDPMMQLKVAAMWQADIYSQPLPVISDMQYQLLFDSALLTRKEKNTNQRKQQRSQVGFIQERSSYANNRLMFGGKAYLNCSGQFCILLEGQQLQQP